MNMKKTFFAIGLSALLLACSSNEEVEFNQQNLLGKWTMTKATQYNASTNTSNGTVDFPANMFCFTYRVDGTVYTTYDDDLDNTFEDQDTNYYQVSTFDGKNIIILATNPSFNPSDTAEVISFTSNLLKWNTKIDKVNSDNSNGAYYFEYEFQKIE
jgi:hypothetical protein